MNPSPGTLEALLLSWKDDRSWYLLHKIDLVIVDFPHTEEEHIYRFPANVTCHTCHLARVLLDFSLSSKCRLFAPAHTVGPKNGAAALPTPGRPPKHNVKTTAYPNMGNKPSSGTSLGPSSHVKPFSQSYGVGLTAGVIAGGWLADAGVVGEPGVGDGGAKRGEYQVRIRGIDADSVLSSLSPNVVRNLFRGLSSRHPSVALGTGLIRRGSDGHVSEERRGASRSYKSRER